MNKPEILEGKVKEFVGLDMYDLIMGKGNMYDLWWKLRYFYSQPFKPEMITEYFEGWVNESIPVIREIAYVNGDDFVYNNAPSENLVSDWCFGKNNFNTANSKGKAILLISTHIKTLSQFITNCIQAGIKLTWREG